MVIFKNGTVIDPASGMMDKRDILVKGKNIVKIAENIDAEAVKADPILPRDKAAGFLRGWWAVRRHRRSRRETAMSPRPEPDR